MIAARTPGATSAGRIGAVGEMLIEDDSLGSQIVERRRVEPLVAVAAQRAQLQTAGDENDCFHGGILRTGSAWHQRAALGTPLVEPVRGGYAVRRCGCDYPLPGVSSVAHG